MGGMREAGINQGLQDFTSSAMLPPFLFGRGGGNSDDGGWSNF
jgi:hypothetical protein